MQVTLLIHLELADVDGSDERAFVWWAESPEIEGFTAAADHLPDLLAQCEAAVPAILHESGDDDAVEFVHKLAVGPEPTGSPAGVSDDHAVRVLLVA